MGASTTVEFDPVAERLLSEGRKRQRSGLRGRERITRWTAAAAFAIVSVPLALLGPAARGTSWLMLGVLLVAFAFASRIEFEVGSGTTVATELVLVPMLFLLPVRVVPVAVATGFVLGYAPDIIRGRFPAERVSILVGNASFSLGPVAVFLAFAEPDARPYAWAILVLALTAQFTTDFVVTVAREWLALGVRPRDLVRPLLWVFMIDALLASVGLAASIAALTTPWAVLVPLPLLGLVWVFSRERKGRLDQALDLSTAYRGTAYLLGDVIEADDEYTGNHSRQVVELVLAVSDELRLDQRSRRRAEFAALLHDVGKIKIPGEIINKPGALTPQEREIINTHTIEGEDLLLRVGGLLGEVGTIVRSCHEDWDGTGYPDGLEGESIPLVARIIACCDAFNAITTTRSYRKGRSPEEALVEIQRCSGTQFDPAVVDALTSVLGAGDRLRA
jgi:HD-GYP domain-containing protein (c-di-GMP phosphodiesterase class II)